MSAQSAQRDVWPVEIRPQERRGENLYMQEQLSTLTMRVSSLESLQKDHMEQTQRIETNTADLIDTFKALQGAWKVLDWLGKLAKPIGVSIIVATAVWVWLKQFMPSWIAK